MVKKCRIHALRVFLGEPLALALDPEDAAAVRDACAQSPGLDCIPAVTESALALTATTQFNGTPLN